ncbi:hypothetical protein DXG03_000020 [Asterophora parasitica]|uniref:Uncharacterized protein n=1 Tax=Asterophora parasitica TaxID=117018 RepID=A0A9P7KGI4_9AGAR|nr:hypothetical protein DXG03_000020 [Asterophora parasitica]
MWINKLTPTTQNWLGQSLTNTDLKRAQNAELIKRLRDWYAYITQTTQDVPSLLRPWLGIAYITAMQPFADASEGKRLCWKICLFNAAVWLAWKAKRFKGPMMTSFMHNPLSGLSFTLLTSMFRCVQANTLTTKVPSLKRDLVIDLSSILRSAAYYYFIREEDKQQPRQLESTAAWHFLAFFISAGLFSGLVSHLVSAKILYPRVVSQLASSANTAKKTDTWAAAVAASSQTAANTIAKTATPNILPSLGASGAVYGAVTLTALAFPESQVALFIPPSYPINIQYGVGGLLLLDMIGVMRGWRCVN